MKRKLLEKLTLISIFLIFYFLIEIIMFSWLKLGSFPKVMIVDILIAIFLSSIAIIFKSHKTSIIYLSLLLFIFGLIALVNQTMNLELNGEIFSVTQFLYADEALNVFMTDFLHFDAIVTMLAIGFFFLLTIRTISRLFFKKYTHVKFYHLKVFPLYLVIVFTLGFGLDLVLPSYGHYNELYNVSLFKRDSLKRYGMMGFYFKDVDTTLFNSAARDYTLEDLENELIEVDPYDFDESDLSTEYAGLLEGKNVITIMIESGQSFAVNEVLTPNLYKVTQEGLYFPNNHSENKTNVSEVIGILGNYPSSGIIASYYDYDFRYSMPSVLSDLGYRTVYFHENLGRFYDRENMIPELGFEEYYFHEDLFPDEEIYGWGGDYTLDSRTMDRLFDFMFTEDQDQPFYYFWTSLVMHGPYNRNYPSARGKNNLQKFTELGYFDQIDQAEVNGQWNNILEDSSDSEDPGRYRFYQAAMMDFDVALGKLLDRLEDEGLIDDTILMLYGDHNLYYHQMHLRINDVEAGEIHYSEMYKTFFAIYNEELTNAYLSNNPGSTTTIDKFVTPYDILPTYFHLLGIPYDRNFIFGESVLTDHKTVFYSHKMTAFFNDEYFSFNDEMIFYPEDINPNHNLDARFFLMDVEQLSERILWYELWGDVSTKRK
jgi:phosphoglycerol transferase MdoB-like AlkP superfamily enzyme